MIGGVDGNLQEASHLSDDWLWSWRTQTSRGLRAEPMSGRHAAPQTRLTRWLDAVAVVVLFASAILSQVRTHFPWWIFMAIALGRLGFSAVYRWNAKRVEARWREHKLKSPDAH